ncbi:MAG: ABC transporter permease [Actinomycetota bacterium]|nr:ABC transporter permease [Actinomycetota bacterium]
MIRLVRAEFLKLRTTQVWFWLLVASVAITALSVVGQIAGTSNAIELQAHTRDVFASAHMAYIAVFVLGILAVTTEFRYQTITASVLATPSRWALVTAKLVAYALAGIAYALVCLVVELAIAVPWLSGRHIQMQFAHQMGAIAAVLGVVALMALVGMGAGALIKNQIVAVAVGLIVLLILENLILIIPGIKHAYPYLPGGAINAMTTRRAGDRSLNGVQLLPIWGGALVLFAWASLMSIFGAGVTMTRDIT